MNIFDLYADKSKHEDLANIFSYAAQQHEHGLVANFLEKDIWVTEILRLLYDEKLLGDCSVAFKGGTALSKCWGAIERFSEDIDLSIHWADLSGLSEDVELAAWQKSIQSNSQNKKFRDEQQKRLMQWSNDLVDKLNHRLVQYNIEGLTAELEPDSHGEKIDIHFPRVTHSDNDYQLDHILLEFGGRNRGKPTEIIDIDCYMNSIPDFTSLALPKASVMAYQRDFILWEKLTALHQFSTQEKALNPNRLARHWYDVDCLLNMKFDDPLNTSEAMLAVIEMKKHRWASLGVDYEEILQGKLKLIPKVKRLKGIRHDHAEAVAGGMFFTEPDPFDTIVTRLEATQNKFNQHIKSLL
ncbi:nucleotidyl transferase AbiEii/AbiGii toxin family protein [Shewanella basaltis]|uniref:nucleotidyl transferase AbiEii/AbiGii toxin family protein n=1 Tax=Shewanella basaltis TaxID=472183 RepID=UPI00200F5EA0|nr:nucleotidyl transferase AbiEii/AbiGii toxin family protein [Shewanella basaltis]MCL1112345.1 nucleotidyl transferase AbiEii/AbiGii toxin family protein [Shewanella basaltis]